MIYFYAIVMVLAATLLTADMVLVYMEKVKSFGMEKKLFKLKGTTIPVEKFLPENITMVFVFFFVFGASGIFYEFLGLRWFFSLPLGIMSGMLVCFAFQFFLKSAIDKKTGKILPTGDLAADILGWVTEEIDGDGYGVIEFEHNDITFRAPAMSANQTRIPEYEKVIILFEENGFYFVESIREVFEPLNEE